MAFAWGPRDLDAPDQNVFILFFSAFFQDKILIEIIWTKYPEKVDLKLNLDKIIWRQQDLKICLMDIKTLRFYFICLFIDVLFVFE